MQPWRTSSMGHLGGLFLLLTPLSWCPFRGAAVRSLPACHQQLDFRCSDGLCVPRPSVCDGHADCEDGSDEQRCGPYSCRKAAGSFSCGPSDVCLPDNKLCDGRPDCRDGRDEAPRLCGLSRPRPQNSLTCAASEFRCGDGQCVRHSWRCDHSPDCSDGSDEDDCDQNECRVNNGGCSHQCVDLPLGFHCDCPDGMRLVGDSRCEDVDQCLDGDACDQLCVHTNGSLTCGCNEDYRMDPATGECKAKGDEAQLVFTSSKGIGWMSITGSESREPAPHVLGPGPVAALASNGTLYWAGRGRGSVYRVSVDGKTEDSELVLRFQGSASGLAVDWIHQLLYWTGPESGSVSVGLLDGSAQRRLITGLDRPSAVAVDPLQGLLFWAQCGSAPKIERASLDGSDRTALVVSSLRQPVALSLDMPRQLLYWADQGMRSISRVNLEGRHRKTVVESNGYLDRPFGLAVFEGFVYWSEEATSSVCRASKHNGGSLQVLLSNATAPGGVVVVQPVLQPKGPSGCGPSGAPCVHGCVVNLLTESLEFSCSASDATFAGILSLIVVLSVLLVGSALWWWREEFRPIKSLTEQSFSLTESQDPLVIQAPHTGPNTGLIKETLLKLHMDGE